jgi:hypothetical protein
MTIEESAGLEAAATQCTPTKAGNIASHPRAVVPVNLSRNPNV